MECLACGEAAVAYLSAKLRDEYWVVELTGGSQCRRG
jgi:hypothetical protein